jgi:transcription elongation factor/antiterminator RfaH
MPSIDCAPNWYVLYTKHKFEKKTADELTYMNIKNYLPLRTVKRRWSDRIKSIQVPLFANYVFVQADLKAKGAILGTPGVVKFVCMGGQPSSIGEDEIKKIQLIEGADCSAEQAPYFSKGDRVKVVNGAFCGIEGTLLRSINQTRLVVRIPLLQQAISIEINSGDIVKIM